MELEQLRTRLASAMEARGYSQKSIDGLASVLNRIRRFSENCHGMDTGAILSRYLKHLDEVGAASGRRRNDASHCIRRLLNLCRGEEISWRVPHVGATPVGPGFEAAIRLIESSETWTSDAVRQNVLSGMRLMFAWMRHRGVSGPSGLTRELVMTYYIEKSSQSRFVKSIRYALKRGLLLVQRKTAQPLSVPISRGHSRQPARKHGPRSAGSDDADTPVRHGSTRAGTRRHRNCGS